jgi:hypothetical protein
MSDHAEFEVRQEGMLVAMSSGPRDRALADIMHYASVYAQDGPVEVVEIVVIATIPNEEP